MIHLSHATLLDHGDITYSPLPLAIFASVTYSNPFVIPFVQVGPFGRDFFRKNIFLLAYRATAWDTTGRRAKGSLQRAAPRGQQTEKQTNCTPP